MTLKAIAGVLLLCISGSPLQSPAQKSGESSAAWPPPSPPAESLHVDLELTASSRQMRLGTESMTLRAELKNNGTHVFFASRNLDSFINTQGYVLIEVTNEKKETTPLYSLYSCFRPLRADSEQWLAILPRHYYGTSIVLDSELQAAFKSPGTYSLTAVYVSHGGTVPPSPEWDVPIHWAWKGEIRSNSVKIKVLPARRTPVKEKNK